MATTTYSMSRLLGQFILSAVSSRAPEGWLSDRVSRWCLSRHPALPAIRLRERGNGHVGWLLGYPISEEGRLLAEQEELQIPAGGMASSPVLEDFIYSFGGRFAAVVLGPHMARFYLDPCGSLSAVYCAHQEMVASTPTLIPIDDRTQERLELASAIGIPHRNGMYPLGMTPRHGVERILPNHYLDLTSYQLLRHWPKQPPSNGASLDEAIAEIIAIVRRNIAAVVAGTPTYLALTSGKDSRMLLACARDLKDRLELYTAQIPDGSAQVDCAVASSIAKKYGLNHRILASEDATQEDLDEWMFRIGSSTGEVRGWKCATMYKRLPGGHAMLRGNVGELARGFWWRADDVETTVISPQRLLAACRCPPHDEPLARADAWLRMAPVANALELLDLFYLEQRLGCWAGVWPYAECDPGFVVFPMCHRVIVERMRRLPAPFRRSGALMETIIAREWPELLDWPFNKLVGLQRVGAELGKIRRRVIAAWMTGKR
jgi:hypothetical protein